MESENQFLTGAAVVVEKAQNIYETNKKVLEDDREHLKKIYSNFSSACDYLTQEMKEGITSIQNVLQLAAQDYDSSKSCNLLESLNDFFNRPANFSTLEANHKMLIAAQKVLIRKISRVEIDYTPSHILIFLYNRSSKVT